MRGVGWERMAQQRDEGHDGRSHLGGRRLVSRSSAGNKEEEEVGGDSEGSSLDIWERLLTIHKRREMEVAAWVYCRAGRGAWDVGEKQGVNCRSVDTARKEGKTRRRRPEALLRRLGLGEQGEWRRARKLYP